MSCRTQGGNSVGPSVRPSVRPPPWAGSGDLRDGRTDGRADGWTEFPGSPRLFIFGGKAWPVLAIVGPISLAKANTDH